LDRGTDLMGEAAAITGLGAVSPLGVGVQPLVERWCAGENGIVDGFGRCVDFNVADHLPLKQARRLDRFSQLAVVAAKEAVEQAGLADSLPYPPQRIGCVIGTGIGGIETLLAGYDAVRERGTKAVPPLLVPMMMANAACAAISLRYGLQGPTFAVSTACASGAHAIGEALSLLRRGEADLVVAGGTEAPLSDLAIAAFAALEALSPSGRSLPFDRRRDGFVLGEGAAVVVLEREDGAHRRGAPILGRLLGYGATSDAYHITAPNEDGRTQAEAISLALADAALAPEQIDYVNAHGTATPLGDRAEALALRLALGESAGEVPVSSTKSAIGHLLGAAGAVEAVATVGALRSGSLPPNVGLDEPDCELGINLVGKEASPIERQGPLRALSNSFGFGGHNAVLCLEA
jgi:3-oxoacyl-[acyl-carrier-protein] synthase II